MTSACSVAIAACAMCEYLKKAICHQHGGDPAVFNQKRDEIHRSLSDLLLIDLIPSSKTTSLNGKDVMRLWSVLGVIGEAGEIADEIVKDISKEEKVDNLELRGELGDLCWYVAAIATQHDIQFGATLLANVEKLSRRYPGGGYNSSDSKSRSDKASILDIQHAK